MAKKPISRYFVYTQMLPEHYSILQELAVNCSKNGLNRLPSILGASTKENTNLAKAYSKNKELYPYAYIISDKESNTPIGCLIANLVKNDLETCIVLNMDIAPYQTIAVFSEFIEFVSDTPYHVIPHIYDKRVFEILKNCELLIKN